MTGQSPPSWSAAIRRRQRRRRRRPRPRPTRRSPPADVPSRSARLRAPAAVIVVDQAPPARRRSAQRASSHAVTRDGTALVPLGADVEPPERRPLPREPAPACWRPARSSRRSASGRAGPPSGSCPAWFGLAGEVEAVPPVRPDPARHADRRARGRRGRGPARRAAPRSTRRRPAAARPASSPRRARPRPARPAADTPSRSRSSRAVDQARSRRSPAATPGRPARTASPPPRRTPTPRSAARARTPASRSRSTAASAETTPSGPSYAPPSSTESRCEPVSTPGPSRRAASHQATGCRRRRPRRRARGAVALLDEPRPQLALGRGERLPEVAAGRRRPPHRREVAPHPLEVVRHAALPWSSRTSYAAAGWSATTPTTRSTRPSSTGRWRNATRAPNAGFSQGWAFLVLDTPEDVAPLLGGATDRRPCDAPGRLAARHDARARRDRAVLQQGGLPEPLRRARQGLDRPGRGPLADAVLAHGRRDGEPADPADRGRRGPGRLLLRHPAGARGRASAREFGIPDDLRPGRRDHASATAPTTTGRAGSPARRPRAAGRSTEVVHRGTGGTPPVHRRRRPVNDRRPRVGLGSETAIGTARRGLVRIPRPPARQAHARCRQPRPATGRWPSSRRWSGSRPSPTATPPASTPRRSTRSSPSSRAQFPLLHERLELTRVHTHGLLFRWAGPQRRAPGRADGAPRRRPRRRRRALAAPAVRRRRSSTARSGAAARSTTRARLAAICEAVETPARGRASCRPRTSGCPSAATRRSPGTAAQAAVAELATPRRTPVVRPRRGRRDRARGVPRRGRPDRRHRRHREGHHLARAAGRGPRRARLHPGADGPDRPARPGDPAPRPGAVPASLPGADRRAVAPDGAARAAAAAPADGQRRPAAPARSPAPSSPPAPSPRR